MTVRPFDPAGLVGQVSAKGMLAKAAAVAADQDNIVLLSLVGYDAVLAALATRVGRKDPIQFTPAEGLQWKTLILRRTEHSSYTRAVTDLKTGSGRDKHLLLWPFSADIGDMRHAPAVPNMEKLAESNAGTRYIFANAEDEQPALATFVGLMGSFALPVDHWWAQELWDTATGCGLVEPIDALGIKAWRVHGKHSQWISILKDIARNK
jgi:hypothetical protein